MIDQATIDRIFDAADIVDVVSDYVTLKRRGANYTGLCPFHDEKTPSFSVSPGKNIYKCFGCGKGGNPVNFIMEVENLPYFEALKFLAKKYHIEFQEKELTVEQLQQKNERESLMSVTEWAQQHFTDNLHNTTEGQSVGMSYFQHRGFREDIIKKFQLGYAIDKRDAYSNEAQKKGYKLEYLEKTGLTIVKENYYILDRFHGRVIFPIHSISGKVIAFGGRAIKKDDQVKYQNSPESDIYHKGNVLYGIFFAKNAIIKERKCYIVEGYADVISMVQAGIENIVAPCGTALTVEQIRLLHRILPSVDSERGEGNKNVTMLYDGDAAGVHAALKNGKLLLEEGLNVKVVVLPAEDDPDTFAQKNNASDVLRYLTENETDYILFKTRYYLNEAQQDPIKKAQLITDIASTIAVIPDQIKRSVYIKECAKILETEERFFYSSINKIRQGKFDKEVQSNYGDSSPFSEAQRVPTPLTVEERVEPSRSVSFELEEKNIIYFLVRYGDLLMSNGNSEQEEVKEIHVVDYIKAELEIDDLTFSNPLYQQMLVDFSERFSQNEISSERFFTYHQNPEYSRIASDILSDPYTLSKMYDKDISDNKIKTKKVDKEEKDCLAELVPHVVMDFKFKWLSSEMQKKLLLLKDIKDDSEIESLIKEIRQYQICLKELAKELGERIVL